MSKPTVDGPGEWSEPQEVLEALERDVLLGKGGRLGSLHRQVGGRSERTERSHEQLVAGERVQGLGQAAGQRARAGRLALGLRHRGRVDVDWFARVEPLP